VRSEGDVKTWMVAAIRCVAPGLSTCASDQWTSAAPNDQHERLQAMMVSGAASQTATDKITKHGHYVFTVDDPNNEWRCQVVSVDTQRWSASAFTIVCVKPHTVTDEREKGGSR
jgi:hypothetical protein